MNCRDYDRSRFRNYKKLAFWFSRHCFGLKQSNQLGYIITKGFSPFRHFLLSHLLSEGSVAHAYHVQGGWIAKPLFPIREYGKRKPPVLCSCLP